MKSRSLLLLAGAGFLVLCVWWQPIIGLVLVALAFLWWLSLRPSNDRDWSPEYAETPWAEIKGDEVTIHNFRNCEYRSETDFTPRWESKTVHLSNLRGVDFFMNYFGSRHIAHTLLSFDFGAEGRVCTSIETRREREEGYSPLRGLFRQYELYYVIGDERDLVRVRTNFRGQKVYLYPLVQASPERLHNLFLRYLRAANELRARPRWYHALVDNCTTNIRVNAEESGLRAPWDWRVLLNGYVDELLYRRGMIQSSLGFAETKAAADITERAKKAGATPDFSDQIRTPIS